MDIRKITEQLTEGSGVSGNCHTMTKAKELLETTHMPISQISDIVGMQNQNYFSRIFKKHMKMSPMQWRNSH